MKFAVVILSRGDDVHIEAFRHVAETMRAALADLGHDAMLVTGACDVASERRCIVFGATHAERLGLKLPPDAILYNMEQVGSTWFTPSLVQLYSKHVVWDYSQANADRYGELGLPMPVVVPFGYHTSLERVAHLTEDQRDVDVLFYGSMNPRRKRVLVDLVNRGLAVKHLFAVYGDELNAELARAKVVVNVHYYESAVFEAARVNYCVANHVPVVSEHSANREGGSVCVSCTYEKLGDVVELMVRNVDERTELANISLENYRALPTMAENLIAALNADELVGKPQLVLSMIVKNESKVIRRALASVREHITSWCIVDTGSTDGTQDIIREFMSDIPGELIEQPWTREDVNRTQALQAASKWAPHILWIDADETFEVEPGFVMPPLHADAYNVMVHYGPVEYARVQVLKSALAWKWHGRVHPYLAVEAGSAPAVLLEGCFTVPHPDGASWSDPDKYKKHAALLLEDVNDDPENPRLRYYLAQSYRDAGMLEEALAAYMHRSNMQGWVEETWSSAYEAAKLRERLEQAPTLVVAEYMNAYRARPCRAEVLCRLGRYLRLRGENEAASVFLRAAAHAPIPNDRLFVELAPYQWQSLDELSLVLFNMGDMVGTHDVLNALLQRQVPPHEQARIANNAKVMGWTAS